jgi:lipid-A-disaccharide synthase-like uncharacterized protein
VYHYRDQSYRFIINARTGEVQGQRPYSFWKITLLGSSILAVILFIVLLVHMSR